MTDLILEGDFAAARKWHQKLFALAKNMLGLASNPIPLKAAMAMLEMASDEMRLPMTPLTDAEKAKLKKCLTDYGLIH
jgi:4-hydroxy-tetrahydrodipicolinate synthase